MRLNGGHLTVHTARDRKILSRRPDGFSTNARDLLHSYDCWFSHEADSPIKEVLNANSQNLSPLALRIPKLVVAMCLT